MFDSHETNQSMKIDAPAEISALKDLALKLLPDSLCIIWLRARGWWVNDYRYYAQLERFGDNAEFSYHEAVKMQMHMDILEKGKIDDNSARQKGY